jgi:hypothetical protein
MRIGQSVLLVVAGLALGFAGGRLRPVAAVHAQDKYAITGGCIAGVPKTWGTFKGASEYGLAFEDSGGTVRFLAHPTCGNGLSSMMAPEPLVDLKIERK